MHTASIGVVGGSGYSGIEALRLLASHPGCELRFVTSDRWSGETVGKRLPIDGAAASVAFQPLDRSLALAEGCDAVLLCTPVEASLELAPALLKKGIRVIDLSAAFRFQDADAFARAHGKAHPHPGLAQEATYGLPEVNAVAVASAGLVANPGCYPTAASLPLWPLLRSGVIESTEIVINAASGTTGAGRKGTEDLSFSEVDEDFRAYRVGKHPHGPEIAQTLSDAAGEKTTPTFTAHLLPIRRGILATLTARLRPGITVDSAVQALHDFTLGKPFLRLASSPDEVSLSRVVGTNRCLFAASGVDGDPGRLIVTSAIDNLIKGASGQAVQNLNLMMGCPETTGLLGLPGAPL